MQTRLQPASKIPGSFCSLIPPMQKIGTVTCSCMARVSLRPTGFAPGFVAVGNNGPNPI